MVSASSQILQIFFFLFLPHQWPLVLPPKLVNCKRWVRTQSRPSVSPFVVFRGFLRTLDYLRKYELGSVSKTPMEGIRTFRDYIPSVDGCHKHKQTFLFLKRKGLSKNWAWNGSNFEISRKSLTFEFLNFEFFLITD